MKTKPAFTTEAKIFWTAQGMSCTDLCRRAGVAPLILARILNGTRQDMVSANADKLRQAMRELNRFFAEVDGMRGKTGSAKCQCLNSAPGPQALCLFTWLAAAWWLGAQKRGRNRKRGFHKQLYIRRRMQ